MPEEIVARILRLPGYGVYVWEADEAANTLTMAIRPTEATPAYLCGSCGLGCRAIHSWTGRRIRDLPWGMWQVWLQVEVHRGALPAMWGADRAPAVRGGQGPLHDTVGGRRRPGL